MRLYQHPMSANSRRALLVIHHLGLSVDLVEVELTSDTDRKTLARINPNVKLPVLDDDGFHLWESNAIMQYLAEKAPGQKVYPAEPRARADVNRWLFWSAQHFTPAIGILTWERWMKPMFGVGEADPREVLRGEPLVEQFLHVLDDHLARCEWLSGKTLTLADFSVAPALATHREAKISLEPYANVARWLDRMRALDAWKKATPS